MAGHIKLNLRTIGCEIKNGLKWLRTKRKQPFYGNSFKPSSSINHSISLTAEYGETGQHRPNSTAALDEL